MTTKIRELLHEAGVRGGTVQHSVASHLATYASSEAWANPSVKRIAEELYIDKSSVRKAIKGLEQLGILERAIQEPEDPRPMRGRPAIVGVTFKVDSYIPRLDETGPTACLDRPHGLSDRLPGLPGRPHGASLPFKKEPEEEPMKIDATSTITEEEPEGNHADQLSRLFSKEGR